jgi:uncharacterized protein DUF4396
MNLLMAGMIPTVMILRRQLPGADNPSTPTFWFVMSMGLLVGFIIAYPMNWWLVANKLKHGMMTVRPAHAHVDAGTSHGHMSHMSMAMDDRRPLRPSLLVMTLLSFLALAAGVAVGRLF